MGLTPTEKSRIVDLATPGATHASLHSGDPSTTGANELTGGTPAYARKALTWGSASAGQAVTVTTAQAFDVPAATTVVFVGFWSALTAGTFRGFVAAGAALTNPLAFSAAAATEIFTAPGHTFTNGQQVMVIDTDGSSLPTGVVENTTYFVIAVSGTTFQLSATSGGAAINLTADGAGHVVAVQNEVFGAQGTYTIAVGQLAYALNAVT